PLHDPLRTLHLRADPAVARFEAAAPLVELVGCDLARQGDHASDAIDGGQPELHRSAEVGIGECRTALADPTIHLGALAAQPRAVELLDPGRDLRQPGTGAEAAKLEGRRIGSDGLRGRAGARSHEAEYDPQGNSSGTRHEATLAEACCGNYRGY